MPTIPARPAVAPPAHLARLTARLAAGFLAGVIVAGPISGPIASRAGQTATGAAMDPQAEAANPDAGIQPLVVRSRPLNRLVYGYLPYWRLDSAIAGRLQYDLLSTIAFFGLGIKADGTIDTAWRGYTAYVSDNAVSVTNAAHAAGVRVVPTFQLFDSGSLSKMTAFLNNTTAQSRFISQALALMARRSADGASIDFEPVPESMAPSFLAFVGRFGAAMKARFPTAQLVVATSAGAGQTLTEGLVPLVDQMFVMTYNYHYSRSTVAGPIAPLDNAPRTVKIHIDRFLARAPASKIIMGIGYYGYDWPVTSNVAYATVRSNASSYGGVWSVTYGSVRDWLTDHPKAVRRFDSAQGSGWFTYWDSTHKTWREVYFEDERSIAAKDDYAIANNLAGIGIWTLGNDSTYPTLWNVIRSKFYAPTHALALRAGAYHLAKRSGKVYADIWETLGNNGNVPETGTITWVIRDNKGQARRHGSIKVTIYPGSSRRWVQASVYLGYATSLSTGTYRLTSSFKGSGGTFIGTPTTFTQPY
jgi:spore germination protein YaaH